MATGGDPEPNLEDNHQFWQRWMENYYLNYLNRDISTLFPRMNKIRYQRFIKMPKGYFRDSGLLHYLLNIETLEDLYSNPIVGHSFEGFVIEEIIKGLQASGITNWRYHYYRTRKGSDVDLILEGYFGVLPIKIKYSSHTTVKQLRSLSDFIEKNQLPFGLVINQSNEAYWLTKKILQIPVNWL